MKITLSLVLAGVFLPLFGMDPLPPVRALQYEENRFAHPGEMKIRSSALGNWYIQGDEVVFSSETKIPEDECVKIVMTDIGGSIYLDTTIFAATFNKNGWRWKSDEPGFYEVRFERLRNSAGDPVREHWTIPIWRMKPDRSGYEEVGRSTFNRSVHALFVAPEKTRAPKEFSTQFLLSDRLNKKVLAFASLIGFRGIRVHTVDWENLEPERGKFDWSSLDQGMALARLHGFQDEDMIFNTFGVPRWASSNPNGNRLEFGTLRNYKTVLPENLDDWKNFLTMLMRRYPKVRTFELWNEPHFPGYSAFWSDTPENHVKLIRAGYEAVKKENPSAVVWWAGLSKRYLEFYRKFLSLGGGQYFDVLSIHGTWQENSTFSEIEKECGISPKPKVNSEWHANLIKPLQAFYPSEIQVARVTMLGFLHMIRQKIETVCFFTMFNEGGCELEELAENRRLGRHDPCVAGLFRVKPYTQPRYVAAAWHTLTAAIRENPVVHDGYEWKTSNDVCRAVHLSSVNGDFLLFWNPGSKIISAPPELRAALKNSRIVYPDGRPASSIDLLKIMPDYYYIAFSPDISRVKEWKNQANVLKPFAPERPLDTNYAGIYRPAPLFDENLNILAPESLKMHAFRKEIACFKGASIGKISAEYAIGFDTSGMDLLVRVHDPIHYGAAKASEFWSVDSIQFALDTLGKGNPSDVLELGVFMNPGDSVYVRKTLSPILEGDLPSRYTPPHSAGLKLKYARAAVSAENGITEYRVHVEPTELYSFVYRKGIHPRFAILVNNNDGKFRESYLEWGSGIGTVKDPALFGTLTVQTPDDDVFTSTDLTFPAGDRGVQPIVRDGIVRVDANSFQNAGVRTGSKACVGGGRYELSFEARGNGNLIAMISGKGIERIDPLKNWQPLSGDWKPFRVNVDLPESAKDVFCTIFYWKQENKWFEIRHFSLRPAPFEK